MKAQIQAPSALGRIVELVRDLRKRCSWDAAQTRETLRPYLVEEVLELDQSIGDGQTSEIRDELGDLLLHLAFQIVIGEERGEFGAEDVTRAVEEKMWRRHPHLFAGQTVAGETDRQGSWERNKLRERAATGRGVLSGLPPSLPVLIMAHRLQERAAGVGFDWLDDRGPREKIREELNEVEAELSTGNKERMEHEIGDLLFAVVNLARKVGVDSRAALEKSNRRFRERFGKIEALAAERGIDIPSAGLKKLDELWEEAKKSN